MRLWRILIVPMVGTNKTFWQTRENRRIYLTNIPFHLEQAIQAGEPMDINRLMTPGQQTHMSSTFDQTGLENLTGAKEILGDLYDYGQLRLSRALNEKG